MAAQEKILANLGHHSFFSKAKKHNLKSNTKTAKSKLGHNDVTLLVRMKLRLGPLHTDIEERFRHYIGLFMVEKYRFSVI